MHHMYSALGFSPSSFSSSRSSQYDYVLSRSSLKYASDIDHAKRVFNALEEVILKLIDVLLATQ